jgi:D-psicose/D-tagatose/L-ribulose 3-epimerase
MTLFGAHAFIWAGDWTPAGAERVISGAANAGLDFVEIPLLRPDDMDVAGTRELLDQYGIECTCSLGLPEEAHLPFNPQKAEEFLTQAVDVTVNLGSTALSGAIYTNLGTLTGEPPSDEELETVVQVLKRVARYAAGRDLQLGIEPVNRYESYLINLSEQVGDILNRIDEPNVFAHLDTYHMNIEEKGFYDPIVELGDKLKYIHLSESDRGTPGTGNVHWDEVFRGLRDIGYEGHLVMESFAAINKDIAGATAIWRDVVGDPEALVRDGLSFLRDKTAEYGISTL